MTKQEFIEAMARYVQKYAPQYGISVCSPVIAQGILESGWGKSKLAATYHNYFGLKCGTKWKGKSVNLKTQEEFTVGTLTTITDNFRVYDSMEEGVKGYFEFIQLSRYQNLKGITDPKKYLETIKADGYATSSNYVESNMKIVTDYKLAKYDKEERKEMGYSRQAVADTVNSWVGKKESDGSFKSIIDLYNSKPPFPRNTKMLYSWAWCAATWSAIAKKLGYEAIMPIEISCFYLIEEAKKMGCWQENDAFVPGVGDGILYDWDDNGIGDNKGNPDHVGTVTYVNKDSGYMVVTEGNYSESVKKRTISINGRFIRGFMTPKYTDNAVQKPKQEAGKSVSEVAHEVIAGKWGDGAERRNALAAKGYNAAEVQQAVNDILNGKAVKPKQPEQSQKQPIAKKVTSTCYAAKKDNAVAGTYKTTAALYCRNDAGTNKAALCLIPEGTEVKCYGYYTPFKGTKWLYIQFTIDGVQYTGFSSAAYLKKIA